MRIDKFNFITALTLIFSASALLAGGGGGGGGSPSPTPTPTTYPCFYEVYGVNQPNGNLGDLAVNGEKHGNYIDKDACINDANAKKTALCGLTTRSQLTPTKPVKVRIMFKSNTEADLSFDCP